MPHPTPSRNTSRSSSRGSTTSRSTPFLFAAPALSSDLGQGRIPAGCGGLASFVHQHRSGKLRILATSGPARNRVLPDVPTVVELGFPQLQLIDWYAFYAPGGLPPPLIAAWNRALHNAVETPDVRNSSRSTASLSV